MKTREERQDAKRQKADEKARRDFDTSPAGQARRALKDGRKIFELRVTDTDASATIEAIEAEGWHLEHAGWVAVPTKGMLSPETVVHEVGRFIFRRTGA